MKEEEKRREIELLKLQKQVRKLYNIISENMLL